MKSLPVYTAQMTGESDEGIWCISLVDHPAFEHLFAKFSEVKPVPRVSFDTEKRLIVAPLMIPDKLIYRVDDWGNEFFVKFDAATIRLMSDKMMRNGANNNFNLNHEGYLERWQVTASELWIKEFDEDKSNIYGFNCPKGTLFMSAKINDDLIWKKIINEELNGFSIEAYNSFKYEMEKYIYSAIAVGETVFVDKGNGIEKFSGKFSEDGKEVTAENGVITEIKEEVVEPTNDEANVDEPTIDGNSILSAIKQLEEKFGEIQKLSGENKRLAEENALLKLKDKQATLSAQNFASDVQNSKLEKMSKLEVLNMLKSNFKRFK
jgi:hypothetical protein